MRFDLTFYGAAGKNCNLNAAGGRKGEYPELNIWYLQIQMKESKNHTFPLSEIQQAYYIGRNREFELGGKSTQVTYILETKLECDGLEKALNEEIKRQPMLRAIVLNENEQMVLEEVPRYSIRYLDFAYYRSAEQERLLKEEYEKSFSQQFAPDKWPLFEWKYIHADKNYLISSFDLLIADGSSLMVLAHEIRAIYDGQESGLPELGITYRDYIEEKIQKRSEKRYTNDKAYWMNQISSIPDAPKLNYRKMRSHNVKGDEIRRLFVYLSTEEWSHFTKICARKNISQSVAVLTAYAEVLKYWSSEKSFTINMTVTERRRKEKNIIGDFTSSLLIPVTDEDTNPEHFWIHAGELRNIFGLSFRHSSFEGVQVIKELVKQKNMPLMAVMPIVFTSMLFHDKLYDNIFEVGTLIDAVSKTPQVIIDCQVEENNGRLVITWDYVEEYIDGKTVRKMQEQMKNVLLLAADEKSISRAFELPDAERHIWEDYNNTDTPIERMSLIELFERSVRKFPDRTAVSSGELTRTYRELSRLSDAKAAEMKKRGAAPGVNVAVVAHRNIETIADILAVLKTGAAYVPIAPDAGEERIRYILKNSNCVFTLDDSEERSGFSAAEPEAESETRAYGEEFEKNASNFRDTRAYIIYTSGTTGKPKGVSIANCSVANTVQDLNERLQITEDDRFIGISALTFDLSVYDIFGAFSAGAELVLVSDNKDPRELKNLIRAKKITLWNSVPSFLKLILTIMQPDETFDSVRNIMLSGDWIPLMLHGQAKKHFPSSSFYSLGGATEASIWSICYLIRSVDSGWKSIPYGYPLSNQKIYVLDKNLKLCMESVPGEICIGGVGLAIEYDHDPARTARAFIETEEFGRLYKTGDYGVLSPKGYVQIIGRMDFQLKINGYRIEAEEIEAVACRYHKNIHNAVVVPVHDNTQLCCTLETDEEIDKLDFNRFLSSYLPPYMIASEIICIKKMPLTANGKISRNQIVRLAEQRVFKKVVRPRTELENVLFDIWKKVLHRDDFGVRENFFELGGDSIKAAEAFYLLQEEGFKIEISRLFISNTIEKLAYAIEHSDNADEESVEEVGGL